ncbi:unnamed protein product, partial [marine sediment metagenome]
WFTLANLLAKGADANNVDITNVNKLEGADASEYIDLGGDLVEIVSDTSMILNAPLVNVINGSDLRLSTTTAGHEWSIQVYDNDTGPAWVDAMTFTNGNSPTITFNVPLAGLGTWAGHWIGAADATYDLGSTTAGWKDLLLTGTIELGHDT